eukprot:CAMPEP_0201654510 /NCGR_PEP_ID=MMETSP0493-20130528/45534_1 /ASSEMBLY_ACC=CAM_ASM_000838 /TAXON_ID=420259 /ORGANISM="Thalassiosira gravida, Strain GMp14c1" /LENGTH=817 /DNA_ID=CAMNT_0048131071 /DNA_START=797 /DNA_END=3250 /DNA_ORIENTATION=+
MSSRLIRRLREEKEAALLAEEEATNNDESSEEEEDDAGVGNKAFMMMLEEDSSSEDDSSSSSEDEAEDEDKEDDDAIKSAVAPLASAASAKSKKKTKQQTEEEEEDLDAILSDMNIQNGTDHQQSTHVSSSNSSLSHRTLRSLLLSKKHGFELQDLDLDYAMRSLLGGAAAGGGVDDFLGDGQQQQQQQQNQRRRGGQNQRGRRTLAKKYLFGKPRTEWGKPPSYVGGGIGMKELTEGILEEERHTWSIPWPYNLNDDDDNNNDNDNNNPKTPSSIQKWFTLTMSDTYQEQNYIYQEMLSSGNQQQGAGQLHDPNSLAMFVADNPYFAETILQLAMVLYYINDRGRGSDLLRRCMFLYEATLPSNVLPNLNDDDNDDREEGGNNNNGNHEVLIDFDRPPNAGLFSTLFRIMQTSGMSGCHENALATGRFLLSLDPLRDPMGALLILDYYALASRRRRRTTTGKGGATTGEEVETGAKFVVDLVESGGDMIKVHHRDPLTDRHHVCGLADMPNWAYSHALALYRLSLSSDEGVGGDSEEDEELRREQYRERAEDALVRALNRFPAVLPKLLAMNKVNTRDRSFQMDWPSILPHFGGDANETVAGTNDTVEERVTRASGEHLVRIFVQRCHKLWKEDDVVQLLYRCSERVVRQRRQNSAQDDGGADNGEEKDQNSTLPAEDGGDAAPLSPMKSTFSPTLARYAQCDPSEYEDAFRTFPPEAIALDPNIVAPAMAMGMNRRGRFLRRGQQHRGGGGGRGDEDQQDPLDIVRQMLGLRGDEGGAGLGGVEALDPDSPLLQLYLRSLMPWAQVEGVRPPQRD